VLSKLEVAKREEARDIDLDGEPDNKLAIVASLLNPALKDAISKQQVVIPMEFFDLDSAAPDSCVKLAAYLGAFDPESVLDPQGPQRALVPPPSDIVAPPALVLGDGTIEAKNGAMRFHGGPSTFSVHVAYSRNVKFNFQIAGATIEGDLVDSGNGMLAIKNGLLAGVVNVATLNQMKGVTVEEINLTPEDSALDLMFGGLLGSVLTLPMADSNVLAKYPACRTPDIDVDGDGLEAFCDSNLADKVNKVGICIDGDGTEIGNTLDSTGNVVSHCASAVNGENPRFPDGISIAAKFETTPIASIAANPAKKILVFEFLKSESKNLGLPSNVVARIDGTRITATVPFGTDVSNLHLIATFFTSGASVSVGGTVQESDITENDFSNGKQVVYTVTAGDGTTTDYTVTVEVAPNSAKEITDFKFLAGDNGLPDDVIATITDTAITASVPANTDRSQLIATFVTTGATVKVGTVPQTSGSTPNDFSNPVHYTVTADDGTTKDFTVTVTFAPNAASSPRSHSSL
jgi:hypothetical protein